LRNPFDFGAYCNFRQSEGCSGISAKKFENHRFPARASPQIFRRYKQIVKRAKLSFITFPRIFFAPNIILLPKPNQKLIKKTDGTK